MGFKTFHKYIVARFCAGCLVEYRAERCAAAKKGAEGKRLKIPDAARHAYKKVADKAHSAVRRAVARGQLPNLRDMKVVCVDCGSFRAAHYDHRDYTKPLEVAPVCAPCNQARGPAIWQSNKKQRSIAK